MYSKYYWAMTARLVWLPQYNNFVESFINGHAAVRQAMLYSAPALPLLCYPQLVKHLNPVDMINTFGVNLKMLVSTKVLRIEKNYKNFGRRGFQNNFSLVYQHGWWHFCNTKRDNFSLCFYL